jgi:hypothetical protein
MCFLHGAAAGCPTDYSPLSNAKVMDEWNYGIVPPLTPNHCLYALMACRGANLPFNVYRSVSDYPVIYHSLSLYPYNTGPFICSSEYMLCFASLQEIFMFEMNEYKRNVSIIQ